MGDLNDYQKRLKDQHFKPQCFLVDFLPYFGEQLPKEDFQNFGIYTNHQNIITRLPAPAYEDDQSFLDKITIPARTASLLERMPKELMASLNPSVKLYKVLYKDEHDKVGVSLRLPFNNFQDPAEFAKNNPTPLRRGYEGLVPGHLAVGLKQFSFDFIGTNPVEADVFIDCDLRLYFSSVDALFHEYKVNQSFAKRNGLSKDQQTYAFIDLIKRPKKFFKDKAGHRVFNHQHFRVKIEVGYEIPSDDYLDEVLKKTYAVDSRGSIKLKRERERIKLGLKNSRMTLFLNLMRHEINFNTEVPSGPFEVTITYNGAVESTAVADEMDILRPGDRHPGSRQEALNENRNSDTSYEEAKKRLKLWWPSTSTILGAEALAILDNPGMTPDRFFKPFKPIKTPTSAIEASKVIDMRTWSTFLGYQPRHISNWVIPDISSTPRAQKLQESIDDLQKKLANLQKEFSILADYKAAGDARYNDDRMDEIFKDLITVGLELTAKGAELTILWDVDGESNPFPARSAAALVHDLFIAKASLQKSLASADETTDKRRTRAYTRLIKNLLRSIPVGSGNYFHRVYNVPLNVDQIEQWLKTRATGYHTDDEKAELKRAARQSDAAGKTTIKGIKEGLKIRQRSVGDYRDVFIQDLQKKFTDAADQHPPATAGRSDAETNARYRKEVNDRISGVEVAGEVVKVSNPWNQLREGAWSEDDKNYNLRFIYFGDLIDEALQILVEGSNNNLHPNLHLNLWNKKNREKKKNKLHIILGEFEYKDAFKNEMRTINLADVPISYTAFIDFWNTKVVDKLREKYLFKSFVVDVLKELVLKPLKTTCTWTGGGNPGLQPYIDYITIPPSAMGLKVNPVGELFPGASMETSSTRDFTNWAYLTSESKGLDEQVMFISLQTRDPSYIANNKIKDMNNGILYLPMGREGTPLISIDFERIDQPYIMEARADKGLLSDVTQLSEVYNCNFKTYGNLAVRTGKRMYISVPHFGDINSDLKKLTKMTPAELQKLLDTDPRAIQQFSRSRLLGIGGYYLITKTSHQISAQGGRLTWTTEAVTRWDTFGKTPEAFIQQTRPAALAGSRMVKRLKLRKLQEEAKMQELVEEALYGLEEGEVELEIEEGLPDPRFPNGPRQSD